MIADIGGGPGRYTDWLIDAGYTVIHRDVVPHHVDQVRAKHGDTVDTAVGDVRSLDLADASVDAMLCLGPLYHLPEEADRRRAIAEAARVTKSGGVLYVAAIGRWAARLQGILVDQLYVETPDAADRLAETEHTGLIPAIFEGAFTGYTHSPDQLRSEMDRPDMALEAIVAVEGPATMFCDNIVAERLANNVDRAVLLDCLRAVESIPDLLGMSGHLLGIAHRV